MKTRTTGTTRATASSRRRAAGTLAAPVSPASSASRSPSVLQWSGISHWQSLLCLGLLLLVLLSALGVVHSVHRNASAFNELQQLKEEAVALDVTWGQLLIEQSTFGVDGRIEQKAAEQLGLRIPTADDIVLVRQLAEQPEQPERLARVASQTDED